MKKYSVHLDITYSGDVEIEANSEEEAKQIALSKHYQLYEVPYFYYFSSDVVDIEELDTCSNCGCCIEKDRSRFYEDEILCEDCFIQRQAKEMGLVKE